MENTAFFFNMVNMINHITLTVLDYSELLKSLLLKYELVLFGLKSLNILLCHTQI